MRITNDQEDFSRYTVRIHGQVIENVHSADVGTNEVWVHDGSDPTKPVELKTGTVSIERSIERDAEVLHREAIDIMTQVRRMAIGGSSLEEVLAALAPEGSSDELRQGVREVYEQAERSIELREKLGPSKAAVRKRYA